MKRVALFTVLLILAFPMGIFNAQDLPIGSIISTFGNTADDGYLPMDGEYYLAEDYPELASYVTSAGLSELYIQDTGTGEYYIYLPNLGGRMLIGEGRASGYDPGELEPNIWYATLYGTTYDLLDLGGSESVTLTIAQIPPHSHTRLGTTPGSGVVNSVAVRGGAGAADYTSTSSQGGGQSHENRPAYWTVKYWIKAETIMIDPAEMEQAEYIQTVEITDSQGNAHTAAIDYSMSAGDVLICILLIGVLLLGLYDRGKKTLGGKE